MKIPKRAPPVTEEYREMIRKLHEYPDKHPCPKCGSEDVGRVESSAHSDFCLCHNPKCLHRWFQHVDYRTGGCLGCM